MRVIEIVREHLKAGGYGGLCMPDAECGCELDDLVPCDGNFSECKPGYKRDDPDSPGDWIISTTKE